MRSLALIAAAACATALGKCAAIPQDEYPGFDAADLEERSANIPGHMTDWIIHHKSQVGLSDKPAKGNPSFDRFHGAHHGWKHVAKREEGDMRDDVGKDAYPDTSAHDLEARAATPMLGIADWIIRHESQLGRPEQPHKPNSLFNPFHNAHHGAHRIVERDEDDTRDAVEDNLEGAPSVPASSGYEGADDADSDAQASDFDEEDDVDDPGSDSEASAPALPEGPASKLSRRTAPKKPAMNIDDWLVLLLKAQQTGRVQQWKAKTKGLNGLRQPHIDKPEVDYDVQHKYDDDKQRAADLQKLKDLGELYKLNHPTKREVQDGEHKDVEAYDSDETDTDYYSDEEGQNEDDRSTLDKRAIELGNLLRAAKFWHMKPAKPKPRYKIGPGPRHKMHPRDLTVDEAEEVMEEDTDGAATVEKRMTPEQEQQIDRLQGLVDEGFRNEQPWQFKKVAKAEFVANLVHATKAAPHGDGKPHKNPLAPLKVHPRDVGTIDYFDENDAEEDAAAAANSMQKRYTTEQQAQIDRLQGLVDEGVANMKWWHAKQAADLQKHAASLRNIRKGHKRSIPEHQARLHTRDAESTAGLIDETEEDSEDEEMSTYF